MFCVYILFSPSKDQFYVGYTGQSIESRIQKHNTHHKGFTGRVHDWKLVYLEKFETKSEAMKREKEIKGRKSKTYIRQLVESDPVL